jgi:hypothetical protein
MSPGNLGVLQLLTEVTFRRILAFCSSPQPYQQGILIHNKGIFLDGNLVDLL